MAELGEVRGKAHGSGVQCRGGFLGFGKKLRSESYTPGGVKNKSCMSQGNVLGGSGGSRMSLNDLVSG